MCMCVPPTIYKHKHTHTFYYLVMSYHPGVNCAKNIRCVIITMISITDHILYKK